MSLSFVTRRDGQCVGFILARGPSGFEAIIGDENSIGYFKTHDLAIAAITDWAKSNDRGR